MGLKMMSRPWRPQDLLDDIQLMIDEEPDIYLNDRRTTLCMARDFLKAYFDTGLEPEEIKAMAENAETRLLTWCEARYGMTVGQLMDLGKAEQEGRLVVLPCKVGDTVYRIFAPDGREPVISAHTLMSADYIVRWIDKFGKTVFLTREEAERALEANKNIGDKNKKPTE